MIIFTGKRKWSDSQQFQRAECWPVDTSVRRQFYSSLRKVFTGGSNRKESACSTGDPGLIPESGRSSGEGNGYPLQYSCLENSTDSRAWQSTVQGVANSRTQLSNFHFHLCLVNKVTITLCITTG